jgi:hypothetical protein
MLQFDGNDDVYKMECNRMLKYNILYLLFRNVMQDSVDVSDPTTLTIHGGQKNKDSNKRNARQH